MSQRDSTIRLRHMVDYAREAIEMAAGKTAGELANNRQLSLAVIHLIELIGEAANQIPRDFQVKFSQIPWAKIIGTRNRLIHGYDAVDYDILLDTIENDLPGLAQDIQDILEKFPREK